MKNGGRTKLYTMKLLINARNLGQKPSGVGMYAYNFISALLEYPDVKVHVLVDVIESSQIKQLANDSRVKVHSCGYPVNKSLVVYKYYGFVKRKIEEIKPDIFWETNNLAPVKLRNPYGKYLVTIHDVFPFTFPEFYKKFYPQYFRMGLNKTIKCCDGIIYNSRTTQHEVEKFLPKAKTKKSFVSYIIIPPIPGMEVEEKGNFLYLGILEKRKGADILLEAYDRYIERGGTRELVIAGKIIQADIENLLKEKAAKLPSLKYVGYAGGDDRVRYYRECGCFVFPSRAEGFGMPIIEAMSCGKQVIASNLEIFEEIAGGLFEKVDISDESSAADKLASAMLDFSEGSKKPVEEIGDGFSGAVLGAAVKNLFDEFLKD